MFKESEHPTQGGKCQNSYRWDHRLQIQNIFMAFKRVPVTLDQQYNVGEKPTVILYVCMYVCMYGRHI